MEFQKHDKIRLSLSMRLLSRLIETANGLIRRKDYTIRRWLGELEEIRFPACSTPIFGVSSHDVVIDPGNNIWVRVFLPRSSSNEQQQGKRPVVVYYHGGGFAVLRPDFMLYDVFCRRLAKNAGCIVVSVNYRRSPEHRYPAVHDDCFAVLTWFQGNYQHHLPADADVSRCFLSGDSAGGNLAHFVACRAAMEDMSPLSIRGKILINPFFGGEERTASEIMFKDGPIINLEMTDWYWKAYLPDGDDKDHPVCNVFGPRSADISNVALPPSLVIVGEYDPLKDWQLRYAQGLVESGKRVRLLLYKGPVHVFHIFYRLDSSRQVLLDIAEFIGDCN